MVVMEAVMAAMVDMEGMDTDVESEVPLLKLMPKPMLMAAMEVMVDMEDMDTDVESEVPLLKLMPKPMPTMDVVAMEVTVAVMVAVMAVMVDTDTAV